MLDLTKLNLSELRVYGQPAYQESGERVEIATDENTFISESTEFPGSYSMRVVTPQGVVYIPVASGVDVSAKKFFAANCVAIRDITNNQGDVMVAKGTVRPRIVAAE